MSSTTRSLRLVTGSIVSVLLMLFVSSAAQAAPPANDDFADAITLTGATATVNGTTSEATVESGEPDHYDGFSNGTTVWYQWTAPSNDRISVHTRGSSLDSVIAVYTGSTLAEISEPGARIDRNDDEPLANTRTSRVTFTPEAGETYRIVVDGYQGHSGSFDLGIARVGTITGTIVDVNGDPAYPACAMAMTGENRFFNFTPTNADGQYTMDDVVEGEYRIKFEDCRWGSGTMTNFAPEYYDDAQTFAEADPVTVTANGTIPNINAQLGTGNRIVGTITDDQGTVLDNICLSLYRGNAEEAFAYLSTQADGEYAFAGLEDGSYRLHAYSCGSTNVVGEFYENKASREQSDPINVSGGEDRTIDFSLDRGGTITGKVTNSAGDPLSGICVQAYTEDNGYAGGVTTGPDGLYSLGQLRNTGHRIGFFDCSDSGYLDEYYDGARSRPQATLVQVSPGQTTPDIDAVMEMGGRITGTVTGTGNTPLEGICVAVYDEQGDYQSGPQTDQDGEYQSNRLLPGSYKVQFEDCVDGTHVGEYFDDKPNFETANTVTVTDGQDTQANAQLREAGSISGRVTTTSNAPVEDACVYVRDDDGNRLWDDRTDMNGNYKVVGVTGGQWKVQFRACDANVIGEYYNDKPNLATANPVSVTDGVATTNINAQLKPAASFSGRLTNPQGQPLEGVCVEAVDANGSYTNGTESDENGNYSVGGLRTGSYRAVFFYCGNGDNVAREWFDDKANFAAADPISLTEGSNRPNINAQLAPGSTIEGEVTDEQGDPVDGVCVDVIDSDGEVVGGDYVGSSGTYSADGLRAGNYRIKFADCNGNNLVQEYYNDKETLATANQVNVGSGVTVSNINAQLATGGSFTGKVTDSAGNPLVDICVSAYNSAGEYAAGGFTQSNGVFTVSGVRPGTTRASFESCGAGNFEFEYFNDKKTLESADPITIVKNQTTPDINVTMVPDTTAPNVVIESGPNGVTINTTEATFEFRGEPENDLEGFECKLDSGEFEPCGSPVTYTGLGEGNHTVQIVAYDHWNNRSTPATATFTVKTSPDGPTKACLDARARLKKAQTGLTKSSKAKKKAAKAKKAATKAVRKAKKSGRKAKLKKAKRKLKAKSKGLRKANTRVKKSNAAVKSAKAAVAKACG